MEMDNIMDTAFRAMLENTIDMMFVKNANSVYVAASMPFVRMVGKETAEEIIGKTDLEIFENAELAERYLADDKKLLSEGKNLIDYIEPITDDDGHARYGSTSKYILRGEKNEIIGILGITRDITREYIARKHYQQELKYLFELPSDTYAVTYIDIDDWRIISQRRHLIKECTVQPCFSVERLCETALESIVSNGTVATEFYRNFNPNILKRIYKSGRSNLSFKYQRLFSDGSIRWVHNEVRFLINVDDDHLCVMLSAKDIDAEKRAEQELAVAAKMDKMTMVLNREATMASIKKVFKNEQNDIHALFMFDVDNFKKLNDTLGHQSGDQFLIAFATEIKKKFRETDIVGRIGGDEFFALMRRVSSMSEAAKKAQEILSAVQALCEKYAEVQVSVSIGIGVYPANGRTIEELYAQTDGALYEAKKKGKNRVVFVSM